VSRSAPRSLHVVLGTILIAVSPADGLAQQITEAINVRVAASNDDAEEHPSGSTVLTSTDLELVLEVDVQTVGMRFGNVTVPRGASITSAYVQFQVDEATPSGAAALTIEGELSDNASAFAASARNISARPSTGAAVSWNPVPTWPTLGVAGQAQRTPNIATVVEEIVARAGWTSGNALVVIITGSGKRVAESYDGLPSGAPLLHVEYIVGSGDSTTTSTTTSTTSTAPVGATTTLRGIATPPDLAVMYIGDGPQDDLRATAIYGLALDLGVDAIVHAGDFDYADNPDAFWRRVHDNLGSSFPYFVSIGNHDAALWARYRAGAVAQCDRSTDADCFGDYGVNSTVFYKGLTIVLSGVGTQGAGHEAYIRQELGVSDSIWKVCSWHKNQRELQLGNKVSEPGWGVYEACRELGASVINGHEHSYERTKTLVDVDALAVDPTAPDSNTLFVGPGRTFVAVSGLAGATIRGQDRCVGPNGPCTADGDQCVFSTGLGCNDIWAAFYGSDQYGGLIVTYHVDGDPWKARGRFFSVDGMLRDEFVVFSENSLPPPEGTTTTSTFTTTTTAAPTTTTTAAPTTTTTATPTTTTTATPTTTTSTSTLPTTTTTTPATTTTAAPTTSTAVPPSEVTLFNDTFGGGLARWTETGESDWNTESLHATSDYPGAASGSPAAHADNCDTGCTLTLAVPLDLRGYLSARLTLLRFVDALVDAPEFLRLEAWTGTAWVLLGQWTGANGGNDDRWHAEAYDLGAFLGRADFRVRVSTRTSSSSEHVHIDDVVVTALGVSGGTSTSTSPSSTTTVSSAVTTTTALPAASVSLNVRVAASGDDAEESQTGSMSLSSSDLEFVLDGSDVQRVVGMRFRNVTIPFGASVTSAYIQFKVDETSSGTTVLAIRGERTGSAAAFGSGARNISTRLLTAATVAWTVPPWSSTGAAGTAQRTPNIAPVVQEIVNGTGWASGNALVVIVTGSGARVAEAYDGDTSGAPLLHVEYVGAP
jgi:hypothetical protein